MVSCVAPWGADYLLVLKANHSKAFLVVKECCERHCFASKPPACKRCALGPGC